MIVSPTPVSPSWSTSVTTEVTATSMAGTVLVAVDSGSVPVARVAPGPDAVTVATVSTEPASTSPCVTV